MKACEVLRRYAEGRRDFRGVSLRGQSFQGKDLSGADFSEADIRGANFKGAILRRVKFRGAKAGLQKRWAISLVLISWLISGISGFGFGFISYLAAFIFDFSSLQNLVAGWTGLILLIIFYILAIRKGLGSGLGAFAIAFTIVFAIGVAVVIALAVAGALALDLAVAVARALAVVGFLAVALAVGGTVAGAVGGALAGAIGIAVALAGALAVAGAFVFAVGLAFAGAVAVAGSFAFGVAVAGAIVGAIAGTAVSAYLGWRAIKGDPRDAWIRSVALVFASIGGTSFYNADLTDADFTGATLKSTDLRAHCLTRTCWKDAVKLDLARVGQTLLAQAGVRELLVSGYGYKKSYIDANLRGANLAGANLNEANLRFADLSEATLAAAHLDGANLTEVNAVETDFTRASMTGACLEAWNIESSTKLDQVDCQYVFLLEHFNEHGSRERRPSSGEFQPGEFTKLFEEVLNTVDLIFRNGVDWKAFVAAFKKVQVENEDTPLEIQSIENKGDGVIVVKVKVPPDTDKEKIHQDFTQNYELALKAVEEKYKAELKARDEQIVIYREQSADLKKIIKLQASRPINVQAIGSKSVSENSGIHIKAGGSVGAVGGRDVSTPGVLNLGTISGNVTNTIDQLPDSPNPNQPGIKELLAELIAAIADETDIDSEDKAEALEKVKDLAEAGKNPSDGAMKKIAKRATRLLTGMAASLPNATKFVEACNKLLPEIAKIFGLGG